jgi:probable F420-dependent oxidoreductase
MWCSDHVVMPEVVRSRYPFSDDGQIKWEPNEPWYDAIVWCAAIATVTERVEVGPAVLLAGLRHPLVLAKQLASIDALSGGRVIAGFGAGWMAEEFDALGVPFESRGQRLDEWIDICRQAWSGRVSGVGGKLFSAGVEMMTAPQPARAIPILIGGMSDAALRRIAARADGWIPLVRRSLDPVATIGRGVSRLHELAAAAGRDSTEFRVVYNAADPRDAAARLDALARAGVTDVMVDVDYRDPHGPERALEALRGS